MVQHGQCKTSSYSKTINTPDYVEMFPIHRRDRYTAIMSSTHLLYWLSLLFCSSILGIMILWSSITEHHVISGGFTGHHRWLALIRNLVGKFVLVLVTNGALVTKLCLCHCDLLVTDESDFFFKMTLYSSPLTSEEHPLPQQHLSCFRTSGCHLAFIHLI